MEYKEAIPEYQEAFMEYQETFMEHPGAFMGYQEAWSQRGYYRTRSFHGIPTRNYVTPRDVMEYQESILEYQA